MERSELTLFVSLILIGIITCEPYCSRFHYEEKLLEKMIKLEFQVANMKKEIGATQERALDTLNDMQAFKQSLSNEFSDMKEQNRREIEENIDGLTELKDSVSIPAVVFQARSPATVNPVKDQVIVFTITLQDTTQSYDNKTGMFTAPYAGTYLFNVQLCLSDGTKYAYYAIFVGSKAVTNTLLYDYEQRFCNSATAIVSLTYAENVYVKVTGTSGNALREANLE